MRSEATSLNHWRKSARCQANNGCVELAPTTGAGVAVRDGMDDENGPVLRFAPAEWRTFMARARAGGFDLA
ncbi:DUF397 domain-containing protein [Spirillospora sp. CA-294931]|uniref:DUF397 domain-containing protein n=1 Tax=Spirillospora sp. CA-294931 TaxID=3240042 RepID=UPI003D9460C2